MHCHHIGESHDHPPHSPNLSQSTREAIISNDHARKSGISFISLSLLHVPRFFRPSQCVYVCVSPEALCVLAYGLYHPHYKKVRSFLFIREGSSSHKPSCRSVCCCCFLQPSFKSVWYLCSPYNWLQVGVLFASKRKWGPQRPHWWQVNAPIC